MDYTQKLALSYYKTIATLNKEHNIFLVQHQETQKIYVKKILSVYNAEVYKRLVSFPICGIPRIVEYYEEENQLILIENYISGQSLEEVMDNGSLNLPMVLHYVTELCDILWKLHTMNPPIIHRDIKPSNIIITEHNHVMLLDFNAAKFYSNTATKDTVLLGTKGYAAPEQYGFGSSSIKTDIYAVGVLLKKLTEHLPEVPLELQEIIKKCMQMNPSDRYTTVIDVVNAIKNTNYMNQKIPISKSERNISNTYAKYALPGFRTRTAWKMLLAVPGYMMILFLSITLEVENTFGLALWIERFFFGSICLSMVLLTANYMDILRYFPFCKSKYRTLRIAAIVLLNMAVAFVLLLLMSMISSTVSAFVKVV